MSVRHFTLAIGLSAVALAAMPAEAQYKITVLHNNDGESDLLGQGSFGNVAQFATLVDDTRSFYTGLGHGVVTLYAGDSFLPSPEFAASLNSGAPGSRTFFDARAISAIGYDAAAIGNHEFDAGPSVLAEFIQGAQTSNAVPYLSSNLDFTGEPELQAQVGSNIFKSTTVEVPTSDGTKSVGIIGATTTNLPFITSPGNVTINDLAPSINAEVAALQGQPGGVDNIILLSHLQGIGSDAALVPSLSPDIDLIVAGGGDELLATTTAPSPTDVNGLGAPVSIVDTDPTAMPVADYPTTDAGTPIVTGPGSYTTLGRVTLEFDSATGDLLGIDTSSNPQENLGFAADAGIQSDVVDPVTAFVDGLSSQVIATSSQLLPGNEDRDVIRAEEAGLGNLVADGIFKAANDNAGDFGVDAPDLAFVNGGGIRDNVEIGDFSVLNTFDISPFGNVVSLIEDVTREDLKMIFENAYSQTVDGDPTRGVDPDQSTLPGADTGRFLHVSEGVEILYDIFATPLLLDDDGNILQLGERIVDIIINGVPIVVDGTVIAGDTLDIATLDFLAGGGNQIFNPNYLSQDYAFTRLGLTGQVALQSYVQYLSGGNASFDIASDARYDNTPDGRIVAFVPTPTAAAAGLMGLLLVGARRRRARA